MKIEQVKAEAVRPPQWGTTHILTPDFRLLVKSILDFGWLYPIVARVQDATIIDGMSRWVIATSDRNVQARDRGVIPVQWVDCDEKTAKIMHVRLNRARGTIAARHLSSLVKDLIETSGLSDDQLISSLGMTVEEFSVLAEPSLIKLRKLSEHVYSNAWVPVEVAPDSAIVVPEMTFEKPPTPDH